MRRIAIALLVLAVGWTVVGCRRKRPPPPVPPTPPATQTPQQAAQAAKTVVVEYVTALEKGDYRAAHALLTSASKAKHPYQEFAQQAKAGGPLYDKERAGAQLKEKGQAAVTFPHEEDPASTTFTAAKEAGGWRVVYRTGRPWTPYP